MHFGRFFCLNGGSCTYKYWAFPACSCCSEERKSSCTDCDESYHARDFILYVWSCGYDISNSTSRESYEFHEKEFFATLMKFHSKVKRMYLLQSCLPSCRKIIHIQVEHVICQILSVWWVTFKILYNLMSNVL
jgi:hypothetical protein